MDKTAHGGYSILIVDDDSAIRDIYQTFFKDSGFITYTANDGVEGLAMARQYHPTLILLDIMMPKMDGRAMLKELKADAAIKFIPVVIFSALITELGKQESLEAGAVDYIEKSDIESPEALLDKVKNVLKIKD